MAIDLSEPLIPLSQVPTLPFVPRRRRNKKLNIATVFRWAQSGVGGVRLECLKYGGTLCTTQSALLEFFRRLTEPIEGTAAIPRSPTARLRASRRAADELKQMGI